MSSQQQILSPIVTINNNVIAYKSGSFKHNTGLGESKIEATGAGGSITIYTEDFSTKFVKGTVQVACTPQMQTIIQQIKLNRNNNVLNEDYPDGTSRTYLGFTITNDPDLTQEGPDAFFDVEFSTNPNIRS